jgi:protein-S-isoprenylcysteine O-methyltransferase Ste14
MADGGPGGVAAATATHPVTSILPQPMRNPIYLGMVLGLIGLAIAFNSLWLLMTLVPFALVIRYGVITREEAYLERKFGDVYRRYRARVRRWL